MRIGFTGCHRSGKSTLAQWTAEHFELTQILSPAGQIVKDFGFDMGRDNRLNFSMLTADGHSTKADNGVSMQWAIYDTLVASLDECGVNYVSDRTPIDVAAYLLADATGYAGDERAQNATVGMVEQAIVDTQRLFDIVILVPPLPEYEKMEGKPPFNVAYQEHHHMLCRGILFDEDLDVFWDGIRRDSFSHEERQTFVHGMILEWLGTGITKKIAA